MKNNTVITISRQYGCGGRELANILAKKLNIKLYDRQIIHMAAAKLGINDLSEKDLLDLEQHVKPLSLGFIPFCSFGSTMGGGSSTEMFVSESSIIKKLAEDAPCIILGRSADYVLEDNPNHFSIFVSANDDYRAKRGKSVYDKTLKELNTENDKRARYYNYYTGKKWGDPVNYDLVVNTSNTSLEEIADGIIAYIGAVGK